MKIPRSWSEDSEEESEDSEELEAGLGDESFSVVRNAFVLRWVSQEQDP